MALIYHAQLWAVPRHAGSSTSRAGPLSLSPVLWPPPSQPSPQVVPWVGGGSDFLSSAMRALKWVPDEGSAEKALGGRRSWIRSSGRWSVYLRSEFEKISDNKDIVSFLLHVTDPQQNHQYQDNYFADIKIDLSQLWFIYSMNELPTDSALRDRLFVINVPAYSNKEKVHILRDFVIPKMLKNIGIFCILGCCIFCILGC